MVLALPLLLIIAELFWQIFIQYPPSLEQLNLGITGPVGLWTLRIISLIALVIIAFFFSTNLPKKIKQYYWILVLACPALSLVWLSDPLDAIKLFLISGIFYLLTKNGKRYIAGIVISTVVILILNLGVFKGKPIILNIISLKLPQQEVNLRFQIEDNLKPSIEVPRILKRLVYNKIFFALRDTINESLTFFDTETLFFQEVHPQGQKAFVIFFWPEMLLFSLGLWLVLNKKISTDKRILPLIFLSFIYFITSSASNERRLILTIFPISILMASSIDYFLTKSSKEIKLGVIIILFLTSYGWLTNYYDRFVRPDFWLDNRPTAYNFVVTFLKSNTTHYTEILVPNTLSAIDKYCNYYLETCPDFKFEDFNLLARRPEESTLYIGFTGNFLGPNSENTFPQNFDEEISKKGLEILKEIHIRDNIANEYGQDLLIVRAKNQK